MQESNSICDKDGTAKKERDELEEWLSTKKGKKRHWEGVKGFQIEKVLIQNSDGEPRRRKIPGLVSGTKA